MSSPEKFWQGLANAIEQPDLFADPRFATRDARIANQETLIDLLGERFKRRTRDDWCARLQAERRAARADVRHQRGARRPAGHPPADDDAGRAPGDGPVPHRALAGLVRRPARAGRAPAADAGRAQRRDPRAPSTCRRPPHEPPPPDPSRPPGLRRHRPRAGRRPDQDGRALRPRHHDRHDRARRRRRPGQGAEADGRRRQPRRRRRLGRHRPGRQGRGRRPHAGDGHGRHARDQRRAVPQAAVRHDARLRAGRLRRLHADAAGRRRGLAGQVAEGPGGARRAARGRDLRLGRQRHLGPPGRRTARAAPGRPDDPRALQGRRGRDDQRDRRPGRLHVLSPGRGDAADQGPASCARSAPAARCAAARPATCRR